MNFKTSKINYVSNFEISYYYLYLIKILPYIWQKNFFLNTNMFKLLSLNSRFSWPHSNETLNLNSNYKFNTFKSNLINNEKIVKQVTISNKNFLTFSKFFNLIFLFNLATNNNNFKINYNFKLFYLYENSKNLLIIDSNKFINRWKDSYDLIYNIFFFNYNPLVFSTKFFKKETLAINWNFNFFDSNLWNYYFPFFNFKLNKYNYKSNFFFEKLSYTGINFLFITDCTYHYKNIYYMKNNNHFTVGLVNANLDPWIVSYPIISFFDSFISQSFFFKFLISINKLVIYSKFFIFKKKWYNHFLHIYIKS